MYELAHALIKSLAGVDFREDYVLNFFFLDKKETKNQGSRKKTKNFPPKLK